MDNEPIPGSPGIFKHECPAAAATAAAAAAAAAAWVCGHRPSWRGTAPAAVPAIPAGLRSSGGER